MNSDLTLLLEQVRLADLSTPDLAEQFRLSWLSKKGTIASLMSRLGSMEPVERAAFGKEVNILKQLATERYNAAKETFENEGPALPPGFDLTLPVPSLPTGGYHPISLMLQELQDVFMRMGFTLSDGPEIEDDFHNFTALNFPPEHPARDMQDTFFIRKDKNDPSRDLVLRTHTSPVQIRLMQSQKPPIRAIMPGRVYRNETITAKSYCLFYQVEGLYIDKNVTFAELKETLITAAKMLFGENLKYRMRPSFFPFTEPSLEMDIWWERREGGRWLEILGAGMVDPNVIKAVGLDPDEYNGYAFGMGVDRMALRKYSIDDIRILYENDARFLQQFR
jgi:phenylalanyl-tRNA synthetase alpha chain